MRGSRGWLLALMGAIGLLAVLATTTFAGAGTSLKAAHEGSSSTTWLNGSASDCDGTEIEPGTVLWHLLLTSGTDQATQTLTYTFADAGAGSRVADFTTPGPSGSTVLHWNVVTPADDVLRSASTDAVGRNLVLSHVCGGAGGDITIESAPEPLVVRGTAEASFSRTWSWSLEKSVAVDHQVIADGDATFDYAVQLDHGDPIVGDIALGGTATVRNPNDVAVDGVELSVDLDAPGTCSVTDGEGLRVPAGETITRDYFCTPEGHDATDVTVRATWPAVGALDAGSADDAVALDWSVERIDACATVTDSMLDDLGEHRCIGDDDLAVTYAATIAGTAGTCTAHDNTATLVTDDLARTADDTVTVTLCTGLDPAVRVTAEPAFARVWAWTLDKSVAQDRLEVRSGTTADTAWSLAVDATPMDSEWTVSGAITVENPNDWQDLAVDVAAALLGADCRIPGDSHATVPASGSVEVAYVCALGAAATDVTVSATVTVTDGLTPTDSTTASGSATFGDPTRETDACAVLADPMLDDGAEQDPLCTADLPETIDYTSTLTGVPGTCTQIANTATLHLRDSATTTEDAATVDVCVLAVPALTVAADPSFTRTHAWSIVKSVDEQLVRQLGGTTTLHYRVTVAQTGFTDAGWKLRGTIDVTNPNDWTAATVSLTAAVDDGGTCDLTDGAAVELAPGASATRSVSCTWSEAPDPIAGLLTVTATPALAGDPFGSAATPFTFGAPTSVVGGTVTVEDVFAGGPTWTLGVLRASDEAPLTVATDDYARTVGVPASGCVMYTNVARLVETGQSAERTTRVCAPERTGALTIGYWQNKNGQALIAGGAATGGVCRSGTWLRTFAPFTDLGATATCSGVASYAMTVIKAANASGASMNAMLKAQMLAVAFDAWFSDPTLGGDRIGAGRPIGSVVIDVGQTCVDLACGAFEDSAPAFGGRTLTVRQLLAAAADRSTNGGGTWYANSKSTQALAKDVFDAIANEKAFGA